jgi:transposase
MSVMIGIDPHKAVHAACVIDGNEVQLAELTVRSGPRQVGQLIDWAAPFDARTWAIESAGGLGYLLAQQLLARGERVVDVPSTLAARVRLLGSGKSSKNDANDARAVAVAALRAPSLRTVRVEDHVAVLRLLAKAHLDAGRARSQACSRLHALVNELIPGGISKEIVVNQARSTLADIEATSVVQRQRLQLAVELLEEIAVLETKLKCSKARVATAVTASATTLTEMFGVGPIIAAMLIGYTGDPARFPTAGHFAAYNGTAPMEFSSSGRTVHRLSRRGNRTLNHAIHLIAVTQIRHPHSEGRAYYDAKIAAGSPPRTAMRALKRHISNRVFRHLRGDAAC